MPENNSLKINAEYLLVRALTGVIGALPRAMAVIAGQVFARAAYHGFGRLRRVGERNLAIAFPEKSGPERDRILRASFDCLGRQLAEFCLLPSASPEKLRRIIRYDPAGAKRLEEIRKSGRGILFVTAHLGAWELLPFSESAFGNPLSFVVRQIENPKVDRWVRDVRTRFGNVAINKKDAGLACMRILRRGGTLGILTDLNCLPQEGVFVPFFGKLACTTQAAAALALPTNAIVFPVYATWDDEQRTYFFHGGPEIEMIRCGDHEKDLAVNTARIASAIENAIRQFPEQWLWIHDRWHALLRPGDRVCTDFPPL
jgi:Kdo2-lipid IVA lauroyltransferase/acyltransferase